MPVLSLLSADDELDAGDSSSLSQSDVESGTYSSSGTSTSTFDEYDSSTETLGDDGVVIGGSLTTSISDDSGTTDSASETDSMSESLKDQTIDYEEDFESDTEPEQVSGSYTLIDSSSAGSTLLETLAETLGGDGVVATGDESQSLDDTSAETTTETEHPTETTTDTVSDVDTTVTATSSQTDTATESDDDWATESLGTSGTISGGSDCFTISSFDTLTYHDGGAGPESSSDTDLGFMESDLGPGSGTVTMNGESGSSSSLFEQTIGDVLAQGGAIASGSLTYTDTTSDSDAQTKTETGTEDSTDELTLLPSVTVSYGITTTTSDHDSASESGTESLTQGGQISGGSASFSWSTGDSVNRSLGIDGLNAYMNISDSSTDTYGFGESGTESITTGGADTPGTIGFLWTQMGTDHYQIGQANDVVTLVAGATVSLSYDISFLDTVSSSWRDAGTDSLTSGDVLAGETDNWAWNDSDSLSDSASEGLLGYADGSEYLYPGGTYQQVYSIGDVGCDTLATVVTDSASMTLQAASETYTIIQSSLGDDGYDGTAPSFYVGGSGNVFDDIYQSFSLSEVGCDGLSGSLSSASNCYTLNDYSDSSDGANESWDGDGGATSMEYGGAEVTSSLHVVGTNSIASSGTTQSSLSIQYNSVVSGGEFEQTGNGVSIFDVDWYSDPFQYSETVTGFSTIAETGWYAQTAGTTQGSYSYVSQNELTTDITGSDQNNGNWSSDLESGWSPGMFTEVETKAPAGTWTGETWGSFTTSSATEGTLPAGNFLSTSSQPVVSWGSFIENDTNTFLGSIDGQLGTVGGFVSAGILSVSYDPSPWEFAYLGGTTITDRATEGNPYTFQTYIASSYGTSAPDTNSMTPNGLPGEEVARFAYFAGNYSVPDGVSRSDPSDPSAALVAMAAASRNPTDITIPALAGSEGSGGGGGDARIVGGPGPTTAASGGTTSGATSSGGASSTSSGSGSGSPGPGGVEPLAGEGAQGSNLVPVANDGGGGGQGGLRGWLNSWWNYLAGPSDAVPDAEAPPRLHLGDDRSMPRVVDGGSTPGIYNESVPRRFGNVRGLMTEQFPSYAAGVMVDLGTLFVGPEDIALLAALKAGKYVLKPIAKGAKTVLGVFKQGSNLPASPAELAELAKAYKKNLKAAKPLPMMPYGEGLGHHTPPKRMFAGAPGYDPETALAVPKAVMEALKVDHPAVTGAQSSLYSAFAKTGKTLTWKVIEEIETKALIAGGANPEQARATVRMAIQALKNGGITGPMRIPWGE